MTDRYDYVIVGGGTAACVLAHRLTASGEHTVLMLEAGGEPKSLWINIPAGFTRLLNDPVYNWRFQSEPEAGTLGRAISVPRGKGLGGSSLINGMIYVRGQMQDYDAWAALGAAGWSARDVAPYFKRMENYAGGGEHRGRDGPMHITQVAERHPLADAWLQAAAQDGQGLNPDYNGERQDGFGYYQVTQKKGQRWSVVDGYLQPARQRKNLTLQTAAHVLKINVEAGRCTGVTYRQGGRAVTVQATREVILAAGAVQTPQILELSGIGQPALLQSLGIALVHAAPRVGENYIDHFATRMNWRVKNTLTLNETAQGWRVPLAAMQYFTRRTGILTLGTGLVHGFVKTRAELPTPDVQYFFMHASYANAAVRKLDSAPGMTIGVTGLRPTSQGSIHIGSADPLAAPVIRPNFLATAEDRHTLVEGMKTARRLVGQPALADYIVSEMNPGADVQSDDQWLDFARGNGQTIYHPIGTCRMGADSDDNAVVDSRLRFKGLAGLRIVDASVIPAMVSGNTQAAVMMVAERGADLILADAKRPAPDRAPARAPADIAA
ncbi:MAG: choline dehydrogenase [Polaromonas sp. 39-63-203]|jgi:choline dehydrogenase-like flavoprotein|uniref:GMC family oxidoreductase n=1 Tax=Polaromonas sp. TaxID=1869339 RepID=UPI000BC5B5B9|nr:GMC family oxidoreductase N-terminal domain-containing protein [Polaromonas sp.]OYY53167.1 MAG: choline dehydrogenase [Polaromonas sp. 35-63-240]OYZ00562.1 MAG: choline dehydrogenase [Polaromonas sp. 28-63-22]OYZ84498.1 MAG: choline dehydrogenase [Polaromonas sp. 24-62-144]OZB00439.1 MAG: choline dehydrogenase [Polaromonas sp. 39-63-203]HQS31009.1 GMC family oxidoreductase N-terminal domain-containing protein [Polaromonas sp.]